MVSLKERSSSGGRLSTVAIIRPRNSRSNTVRRVPAHRRRNPQRNKHLRQASSRTTGALCSSMVGVQPHFRVSHEADGVACSQGDVQLPRDNRRGVRLPGGRHHCCHRDARGRLVVRRTPGRDAAATRAAHLPEQFCLSLLSLLWRSASRLGNGFPRSCTFSFVWIGSFICACSSSVSHIASLFVLSMLLLMCAIRPNARFTPLFHVLVYVRLPPCTTGIRLRSRPWSSTRIPMSYSFAHCL